MLEELLEETNKQESSTNDNTSNPIEEEKLEESPLVDEIFYTSRNNRLAEKSLGKITSQGSSRNSVQDTEKEDKKSLSTSEALLQNWPYLDSGNE